MVTVKECKQCDFTTFMLFADDIEEWSYCPKCSSLLDTKFESSDISDSVIDADYTYLPNIHRKQELDNTEVIKNDQEYNLNSWNQFIRDNNIQSVYNDI